MARLPRLTVPGQVHHLILRGNNGQAVFHDDQDRERLLQLLQDHAREFAIAVHGYVLMDNHLQLLLTPVDDRLPRYMQAVGRRYVRYFNDRHGRSGTLWEGRYRSTVIDAQAYLLHAMALLDLKPVAAGLAPQPEAWPWSSHRHYIGRLTDRLVTPHALCWELGNTPFARELAYAELVHAGVPGEVQAQLQGATLGGWALGGSEFLGQLTKTTDRRLTPGNAGRPSPKREKPGA
ncbi:transposase [Xylophilus rhododendri]|uniref:Transposase n=1 Tax=Xylophilus rhododendri TaxID=2697032 RepID=A0A857J2Q4_9BURK|nr:transposase [Xylophilus rhododendri]QHI98210.1 transposase [Xylophilus rhododendri]